MSKKILTVFIALLLFLSSSVYAHQPRLVSSGDNIVIENPTVSQAFYATLEGESDRYLTSSDEPFLLLTEVLTPVIANKEPGTFFFTVTNNETGEVLLSGSTTKSDMVFYEPFAGDEYRQGPRFEAEVPAGEYEFVVEGESGEKYNLVIGKRELFPFNEVINTYKSLPSLKMDFFEKPFYTIFTNPTGGVGLAFLIIVLGALVFLYRFLFKQRSKNDL